MAQMKVKLGFKLHWWVKPFMFTAAWGAYPLLWLVGEDVTERYIDALSAFIGRHGIGQCTVEDANYEVTLE